VRARVLVEERRADTWSVCAHCDCGLDVRPIRQVGETLRACCPHDADEDLVLSDADVRRFSIEPDSLALTIARSGGLNEGGGRLGERVWLLGKTATYHVVVLCQNASDLSVPGATLAIKSATGAAATTILAPRFEPADVVRLQEAGLNCRLLAEVMSPIREGMDGLSVERLVPLPAGARLVISPRAMAASLDGRPLDLPIQMFGALRLLVESHQRGAVLLNQEIEARFDRETRFVMRDLRKALIARGVTSDEAEVFVETVRGRGYRLGLQPADVSMTG